MTFRELDRDNNTRIFEITDKWDDKLKIAFSRNSGSTVPNGDLVIYESSASEDSRGVQITRADFERLLITYLEAIDE